MLHIPTPYHSYFTRGKIRVCLAFVGRKTKEGNFIKKEIEKVGYFPMFGFAKIMKGNKKRIRRKITLLCWITKRKMKENKNDD